MGDLALEIGEIGDVAVADGDPADAGRSEVERGWRPEPAGADDQRMGGEQTLLPLDTDFVEEDMAAVAEELAIVHRVPPEPEGTGGRESRVTAWR